MNAPFPAVGHPTGIKRFLPRSAHSGAGNPNSRVESAGPYPGRYILSSHFLRSIILGVMVASVVVLVRGWDYLTGPRYEPGYARRNVTRMPPVSSLSTAPSRILIPRGAEGWTPVFFLATGAHKDSELYMMWVHFSPMAIPVEHGALFRISRTPLVSEERMAVCNEAALLVSRSAGQPVLLVVRPGRRPGWWGRWRAPSARMVHFSEPSEIKDIVFAPSAHSVAVRTVHSPGRYDQMIYDCISGRWSPSERIASTEPVELDDIGVLAKYISDYSWLSTMDSLVSGTD